MPGSASFVSSQSNLAIELGWREALDLVFTKRAPLSRGETLRNLIRFITGQIAWGSESRG